MTNDEYKHAISPLKAIEKALFDIPLPSNQRLCFYPRWMEINLIVITMCSQKRFHFETCSIKYIYNALWLLSQLLMKQIPKWNHVWEHIGNEAHDYVHSGP